MKYKLKKIFRFFGFDIIGFSPVLSNTAQVVMSLQSNSIDTIFDIGANEGQFAIETIHGGYKGKIISFEPQKEMHLKCIDSVKNFKNWTLHEQCAVGEVEGVVELNISKNSVSSSILKVNNTHINSAPQSEYIAKEDVKVITFDSIFDNYKSFGQKFVLKIDTQGFEWHVLMGAKKSLNYVDGIIIEMSLFPLYDNQALWEEIYDLLKTYNFKLWAIQPGLIERTTGKTLQMDCIFFK
jgi:FkbM family methyltransferase